MNLVLATNNDDKIKEIKYLLEDLPVTIFSSDDFLEFPDVEETDQSLKEFQPMNINFGLFPHIEQKTKKKERKKAMSLRALVDLEEWL